MKLETKYLGMSKRFEYRIKSYLKNLTWCEMPWNFLQHIVLLHIQAPKHSLLPSVIFVTHYTPLCWPGLFFSVGGILSGKCLSRIHGTFFFVEWWPWNFLTLPCSISSACTSSTLNLKWSILVCPNFLGILPYNLEL